MSNSIKVSAILLAAGLSSRMGEDKLLMNYRGNPMLWQTVNLLSDLPVYERIIVTTDARLKRISLPPGIKPCINSYPKNGQSESIRIGVEAATGTHYLFLVADQPLLTPADLIPLIKSATENPDKIIYPIINSKPSSPTVFPSKLRTELLTLSDDTGGRVLREVYPELCYTIKPEYPMNFIDIDTIEDFHDLIK